MVKKDFKFPSADGKTDIYGVIWIPDTNPIAILQISHGVTEYILRYEKFAEYLTSRGFVVVGNDDLGHGYSIAPNSAPMYFGPKGSWEWAVKDLHTCYTLTKKQFPDIPYCLLGFSMGSFLVRHFLINYPNDVDAAILMGTGQMASLSLKLGLAVANSEAKKFGEDKPTPKIDSLTFDNYNKIFAPTRTRYDWLCSSNEAIDKYIAEPLRGKSFSSGLFRELLSGMAFTSKQKNIAKMNINLPILLISGDKDPVGGCGKGVKRTYDSFKKAGIHDVSIKLYPNLRHDILHEDCYESVYLDFYKWMLNKLLKKNV